MKYATKEIIINPNNPVKQAGHIQQVNLITKVHDDLKARIFALEDGKQIVIHFSCDLLGLDYQYTKEMNEYAKTVFNKQVNVILSTTHTHYAGYSSDEVYKKQLMKQFKDSISSLEFKEGDLSYSYQYEPFEKVGTSRITDHKALVLLCLIRLYDADKEIMNIINYNCHPTVLSAVETDFFSSEYVGYSLAKLKENSDTLYTFLQGAAGDVSTRFTRTGQHYEDVEHLGNLFVDKINELKSREVNKNKIEHISYEEKEIPITFDFSEIDMSYMPDNLSARELETIEFGKIMRQRLMDQPEKLQKIMKISKIDLSGLSMIFAPNELFSYYLKQIDHSKAILTCYSNGYSPYVPPLDKILYTYETFYDVLSLNTKNELVSCLKNFSK